MAQEILNIPAVNTEDQKARQDIVATHTAVQEWITRFYRGTPMAAGQLVADKEIEVGENTVAHGLTRSPEGVLVVSDLAPSVFVAAHQTATQTIATGGSEKLVEFDTVSHDWSDSFTAWTGASGSTFTAPHKGLYQIFWRVAYSNFASGALMYSKVESSSARAFGVFQESGGTGIISSGGSIHAILNADEVVGVNTYQASGSSRTTRAGYDDTRIIIKSDDTYTMGAHDTNNLKVFSARERTMSFWVW